MRDSRTKNTTRNIGTGLINKAISIFLPFINRTVIIIFLGAEFTGLSGLFSSILEVLNLADLGFNISIVYSLYRPMAEENESKICEQITIFRKIYSIVGTIVFVIGIALMPFIKCFISGAYPTVINIYIVYLLYLINSGISYYLFSYKEVLLIADQRSDILNNIKTLISILRYLMQFVALVMFKDFYMYLFVAIVGTVTQNILVYIITVRKYPRYKCLKTKMAHLPEGIKTQMGGLMIDRICNICRNSFDNIIISSFMGLIATAIYGNYYYIYNAVYQFMLVISSSMSASIGNSIVNETVDKNYKDLLMFSFIYSWITGWCTVTLICLYQHFMFLWVGNDLMLSEYQMVLFCVYFYAMSMNNIRNQYISGTGMWWRLKLIYIFEAVSNLVLNIMLGRVLGITGVLLATIITIIVFNFILRTLVLFKFYFKGKSIIRFFSGHAFYSCIILVTVIITYSLCLQVGLPGISGMLIKLVICMTLPNILFLFIFSRSKQFQEFKLFLEKSVLLMKHNKK